MLPLFHRSFLVLLFLLNSAGCEKATWKPVEADKNQITLAGSLMTIHSGPVGMGAHKGEASYALVDATNASKDAVMVTLAGNLLNKESEPVGAFTHQSLRIPPGGTRTFALVDDQETIRSTATGASIEIASASIVTYPEQMAIREFHQYEDGDRVVVKAYLQSMVPRAGSAVVFATFYDKSGRPMKRPATVLRLQGKTKRGVQFVGPSGSVRGTMAVGEMNF